MKELSKYQLFKIFVEDAKHPFSGWDFSYIRDRLETEPLTWSYPSIIIPYIRSVESMLDMGTGGGEFLLSLQPLPKKTFATESYEPNIPIAKKTLEPKSVTVKSFKNEEELPFEDEQFDLIINRHESFSSKEVYRILKPGGYFITQQVGGKNDLELNYELGLKVDNSTYEFLHWNLAYAVKQLEEMKFTIEQESECFPKTICHDIGAIIYYLKAIPWQVPDFSVEKFEPKLKDLFLKMQEKGPLELSSHRFVIVAKK